LEDNVHNDIKNPGSMCQTGGGGQWRQKKKKEKKKERIKEEGKIDNC